MWSGSEESFDGKRYDIVRTADALRPLGSAAAYVFAREITDRASIIDRLGTAVPRLR